MVGVCVTVSELSLAFIIDTRITGVEFVRVLGLFSISINPLAFYHKCGNLIGYATRHLFRDR